MFGSTIPQSVVLHLGAVTDVSTAGFKVGGFKLPRAGTIVSAYGMLRTAVGAGTISMILLDGSIDGAGTSGIGTLGTASALAANTPVAFTMGANNTVDATDIVLVQIKGDGTLDLVDAQVQLDYMFADPAAVA